MRRVFIISGPDYNFYTCSIQTCWVGFQEQNEVGENNDISSFVKDLV